MSFKEPTFGYPSMVITPGDEVEWGVVTPRGFDANCGRHVVSRVDQDTVYFEKGLGPQPIENIQTSYRNSTFWWFIKNRKKTVIIS